MPEVLEPGPEGQSPQIKGIATTCRDCIFAQWEGNTQVGCEWNRLMIFERQGTEILGFDDGKKQYLVVNGRFCNYCRNHDWGKRYPKKDWADIVQRDARVRCSMIVYADDKSSLVNIERSLTSVLEQDLEPWNVVLLINQAQEEPRVYRRLIESMDFQIPWELRQIVVQKDLEGKDYIADMKESIDLTIIHCKATYYSIGKAGYKWPTNFISVLESAVNDKLDRFIALTPDENGNGLLVQTILHNTLKGSKVKDVLEKITEIADEESTHHMVKTFEELR